MRWIFFKLRNWASDLSEKICSTTLKDNLSALKSFLIYKIEDFIDYNVECLYEITVLSWFSYDYEFI